MPRLLEAVYLATCPFCDYRQLFSSQFSMTRVYGAHLRAHEQDGLATRRSGAAAARPWLHKVAEHVRRLEAAQDN